MKATPESVRRTAGGWLDRFFGSDPGLNRFRNALQSVLTITAALGAEWLFAGQARALQIETPHGVVLPAAKVAQANHDLLVIAMLLGAVVGMLSSLGSMDSTAKGQLISLLLLPAPLIAMLTAGMAIGRYRVASLVGIAVVVAAGAYLRRFGPRGFTAGIALWVGYLLGFFLRTDIPMTDIGWLTAQIGVGLLVAVAIRFGFFYPRPARALRRTQRSFAARARKVAGLALELIGEPSDTERGERRLHRALVRLNEAALMIDAQLGDPTAVADGSSAQLLHQRLFDVELALTNIARFAPAMGRLGLPSDQLHAARLALTVMVGNNPGDAKAHAVHLTELLRAGGPPPAGELRLALVIPHRFADSVVSLADAWTDWFSLGDAEEEPDDFHPAVMLFGGWLPGSTQVSAVASMEPGSGLRDRVRMAPYTRTAIQMGLAVGGAVAAGVAISGSRFYWAVIAAFVSFMGTNNAGEQVRKALLRVLGTVVGIAIGSALVRAVGHDTDWSVALILISLFFGFYLLRVNFAFMAIGITVTVSQLYAQLDEFSNHLLLVRLEETALGAAVTIVVVLEVFPLRTRRVLRVAMRDHVQVLSTLVDHAIARLVSHDAVGGNPLRADARAVDAAYQAVVSTAQPLQRNLFGSHDPETGDELRLVAASRNYSRNLVVDVGGADVLDNETRADIEMASAVLQRSLHALAEDEAESGDVYTRSAALFDRAERRLEVQAPAVDARLLAVRDLKLLDGTMAGLAELNGLAITDFDTTALTAAGEGVQE